MALYPGRFITHVYERKFKHHFFFRLSVKQVQCLLFLRVAFEYERFSYPDLVNKLAHEMEELRGSNEITGFDRLAELVERIAGVLDRLCLYRESRIGEEATLLN